MPGPVFLEGDEVSLHPIEPADAPDLAAIVNDPAVRAGVGRDYPLSEAGEREWIESLDEAEPDGIHLVVRADGESVGTVGVADVVQRWGTGELGYMIDPDAWNRGYATDAVRTLCAFLFDELRFEHVTAKVYATNPASARVLEKAGFEREGTLREHAYADGERVDLHLYGLLAREWRE